MRSISALLIGVKLVIAGFTVSRAFATPVDVAPSELKLNPVAVTVLLSLTVGSVIDTAPVAELILTPVGRAPVLSH